MVGHQQLPGGILVSRRAGKTSEPQRPIGPVRSRIMGESTQQLSRTWVWRAGPKSIVQGTVVFEPILESTLESTLESEPRSDLRSSDTVNTERERATAACIWSLAAVPSPSMATGDATKMHRVTN